MNGERKIFKRRVLPFLALLLLGFLGIEYWNVGPPPSIRITPDLPAIGKRTGFQIEASVPRRGLSWIRAELVQGENAAILGVRQYQPRSKWAFWGAATGQDILKVEAGTTTISGLKSGPATIRVTAGRAGTLLRHPEPATELLVLPVRLHPPSLQVLSSQVYVAQGGAEAVVYRVGENTVRDGVRSGEWWFPGYPLPGGGKQDRFAIFSVPYDQDKPQARIVAADEAENEAEAAFIDQFFPRRPRSDRIALSEAFMGKVVPEIMGQTSEMEDRGSLLDNYLAINGELRRKQNDELKALASKSRPEFLWKRPFMMMPNAKVMALFAEHRTYQYEGRTVDEQDHLGYDLASIRHAPVPAANDGIVVLARYYGIYGNTVIIDHGFGLMTLYGHLSSITVSAGQPVGRGDILGRSGDSGLAGGDHLHFAILLQGLPVNPVEWWDAHWIEDRIARKLTPYWKFEG